MLTLDQTNPRGGCSMFIPQLIIDVRVSATGAQGLRGQATAH